VLNSLRNREIARLFSDENKEVEELASMFGLSKRTIQRALKSTLPAFTSGGESEADDK
jgi:hypothetical protein